MEQEQIQPQNKSSIGSIIGTIIIIAVIILGGLYFWGKRIEEAKLKQELISDSMESAQNQEVDPDANINKTGSADDLNSIEADLNSTKLDNLDTELNASLQ